MNLTDWLPLLFACLVISLTPGAGAVNTMTNSLRAGWLRSFWGILGQVFALIAFILLVATGVGVIVSQSPVLFNVIRYVGAGYMIYLGARLFFTKIDHSEVDQYSSTPQVESAWSMMRRGFWVNILNPKAIVFFLAFMPQFIRPNEPLLQQYLVFTLTNVVVDIIVMWGVFAAAAKPFQRFSHTPRGQKIINSVFGSLFVAVAVMMIFLH